MKVQECPQCGAPLEASERQCRYCKSRFFVDAPQSKPETISPSVQSRVGSGGQAKNHAADVRQRVEEYRSQFPVPIVVAAMSGDADGVKLLLEEGADVDEMDDGKTALHEASSAGRVEVLNLLLENGADIDAEDNDGMTPLIWAVMLAQVSAVETLLNNGANTMHKDSEGRTALKLAKEMVGVDRFRGDQNHHRILELLKPYDG